MRKFTPASRPQQDRATTAAQLEVMGVSEPVALLGIRGYYLDTMGERGKNDRGIYDDAIMLVSTEAYVTFNANCDPSIFRPRIASLRPGVWRYRLGTHGLSKPKPRQYTALVQAAPVTVIRDQVGEDTGYFGINIHRGGINSTSSEGCQTIHPYQWDAFIALVRAELKRHERKSLPYALTEVAR